ncbi:MAG: redoxin domain-containing protein [Planctomycetota bacterium]|nr:redoxin domain-containing protein [Planctomycetota bacterium]
MKTGTTVWALTLMTLISTWGFSGCANEAPVENAKTDTHNTDAEKRDKDANHGEAHVAAESANHKGEEQATHHDHKNHDHQRSGHDGHHSAEHHAGTHHDSETALEARVKIGDKVPDFSVQTIDGQSVKLSELQQDEKRTSQGVVVFSFWCTTCHSCRDVEHLIAELSKKYEGQAAVIALGANADETAESVAAFLRESGLDLPVVLDPGGTSADLFGVKTTTTTVVIDGNGILRYCGQFRQKDGGSAEDALEAVLAGNEIAIQTTPHRG